MNSHNQGTSNDIAYKDYTNTAIGSGISDCTSNPNSTINIIKNKILIMQSDSFEVDQETDQAKQK